MAFDLVEIRMKLSGAKQSAAEAKMVDDAMEKTGDTAVSSSKKSSAATSTIAQNLRKQSASMRSTGRSMTYGLTLPLIGAGVWAVKTAATFDRSMAQVRVAGNVGGKGMEELEGLAIEMGAKTIFSANDSAEAMLELIKSGITPAQVKAGALASTMNLAATEGLELGRSAEIVGQAMNTFKIRADESRRVADALAGGALASSASVEGLAMSLAQGGQSSAMYGLSVEETVGALAAFAQNGIKASDAGTSWKTFLMRLNPVTKKAKEEMARLGLNFFDADGKMISIAETSRVLRDRLGDLSDKQRNAALGVLFGTDAIRAANIVYREGPAGIRKYVRATEQRGAAEKMANAQMEGLPGAIERLKGSLETAALAAGHALAPAIETVGGVIEDLANAFTELDPEMQTIIVSFLALVAIAGPLLMAIGFMIPGILALGTAFTFLTGPVGLSIMAFVALAVGLYLAYKYVKPFHDAIDFMVDALGGAANAIAFVVRAFSPMAAVAILVVAHLDWIKNAANNVANFFRRLPGRIADGLSRLPRIFGQVIAYVIVLWATLPFRLAKLAARVVPKVASAIISGVPALLEAGVKLMDGVKRGAQNGAVAIFNWAVGLAPKLAEKIASAASALFDVGKQIASEIASGLASGLKELLPGPVVDAIEGAAGVAGEVGGFIGGAAEEVLPFAAGTSFHPGGLSLVGEEGPELVNLPRGTEVTPAPKTKKLLAGPSEARTSTAARAVREGRDRFLVAQPIKIGKRTVAEATVEAQEDEEARS